MIGMRCLALGVVLTSAGGADWPTVPAVEAQPLIAQAGRVGQALELLGQPLPKEAAAVLGRLRADDGPAAVAAVQQHLDPLCVAAVVLGESGVTRVVPADGRRELVEQGWRPFLVKVVNPVGATGRLRVDSPNARPVPHAPAADVPARWLGLEAYTAQPLLPDLSGLGLEYTVIQMYSRDAGEKTADLTFRVEGGTGLTVGKGPVIREWRFADGADGWTADHNVRFEPPAGVLKMTLTGPDPYFSTPLAGGRGKLVLRFWANFSRPGVGQVFWWTKGRSQPSGTDQVPFNLQPGRGTEYEVAFNCADELAGIRIDPGNDPGTASFDWITLGHAADPSANTGTARLTFDAQPSMPVTFRVTEADGTPTTAGFVIRDAQQRVYPAQAKRLAPDFFFHPQVYRATGETVRLPAGRYSVDCSRGPESVPETKDLVVGDGPATFDYKVKRWTDPARRGWQSGDHHIHAAGCLHYENPTQGVEPADMMRHVLGEDLKVGCCLTWGPCFDYQKQFFTGKPADVSRPPHLLRYDVEVSGFGSHQSGHLNLLNLSEQIPPGGGSKDHWPTLGLNTLRWAKQQGAVCGPAHSGNGLTRFIGRVEGATDGPDGLPHFNIPAYDGIGANEFVMDLAHTVPGPGGTSVPAVDFISTMNTDRRAEWTMWYHALNCGFRVRASGETDFPCITGDRVGLGRVYVKTDGPLTFDKWVRGVADGRSYVSDGTTHLMDFAATAGAMRREVGVDGSEVRLDAPGALTFKVWAAARHPGRKSVPVELVMNGLPVATRELPADGTEQELTFAADVTRSSWLAVRANPHAHTNPVFVTVGGAPIRADRQSAEWLLRGVDQCWSMKKDTYAEAERQQAEADYEHARQVYRAIRAECRQE